MRRALFALSVFVPFFTLGIGLANPPAELVLFAVLCSLWASAEVIGMIVMEGEL